MLDRDERRLDLSAARADGWYERVVASFAPLERLANYLGDGLVALALSAGFRIGAVQSDRLAGTVSELTWSRQSQPIDSPEQAKIELGADVTHGSVASLRTAVLAALVGDSEPTATLPEGEPDHEALRAYLGHRTVLLAPLFGLSLSELRLSNGGDARVAVAHDGIEEVVALKQLRRFLRQRVVEVLQGDSGRGQVAIELAQADLARSALDAGRPEETVARLISWLAPLSVFHRTAEGQALDRATRARLARALGTLAEAFSRLNRLEERNEVLRLSLQYALDGEAAPELYLALARAMLDEKREPEAIGPLRRALALGADELLVLPLLGVAFARSGRLVAALGCARALRSKGAADSALDKLVCAALGPAADEFEHWVERGQLAEKTATMPALVPNEVIERSDDLSSREANVGDSGDAETTQIALPPAAPEDTAIDQPIEAIAAIVDAQHGSPDGSSER